MKVDLKELLSILGALLAVIGSVFSILTQEYKQRILKNELLKPYQTKEFKGYGEIERRDYGLGSKSNHGPIYGSANRPDNTQSVERVLTDSSVRRGKRFLVGFLIVLGLLSVYTFYRFAPQISEEKIILFFWLFISMLLGMIVRVITANHRVGKSLFDVKIDDLVYPILFSVFIFYPIWTMVEKEASIPFSIYSAFLNGYFWRAIVADAKPDNKRDTTKKSVE